MGQTSHHRPPASRHPRHSQSPPSFTPPSHAPYLAKGQPAPSPVGSLCVSAAFGPASALYRTNDDTLPASRDWSPRSLLPESPRLSFTIGCC